MSRVSKALQSLPGLLSLLKTIMLPALSYRYGKSGFLQNSSLSTSLLRSMTLTPGCGTSKGNSGLPSSAGPHHHGLSAGNGGHHGGLLAGTGGNHGGLLPAFPKKFRLLPKKFCLLPAMANSIFAFLQQTDLILSCVDILYTC